MLMVTANPTGSCCEASIQSQLGGQKRVLLVSREAQLNLAKCYKKMHSTSTSTQYGAEQSEVKQHLTSKGLRP